LYAYLHKTGVSVSIRRYEAVEQRQYDRGEFARSAVFGSASNAEQVLRLCVYSKIGEQAENSISAIEKLQGAKSSDRYFLLVRAFAHGHKYIRLFSWDAHHRFIDQGDLCALFP
jgi:hypothetical protein